MAKTIVGSGTGGTQGAITLVRSKASATGLQLVLSCTGGPCDGKLSIAAKEHLNGTTPTAVSASAKKHRSKRTTKRIVLATGHYVLSPIATQGVKLALSRQAVRLLAKLHRLSGQLRITPTGATRPAITKKVTFRSPSPRPKRMRH
jgi:hypothetical protein